MKKLYPFLVIMLIAVVYTYNQDGNKQSPLPLATAIEHSTMPALQKTSSSWCSHGGVWSAERQANRPMVYFYERSNPYYEFTNFYAPQGGITIDGKIWPTTEHYYQAMKFNDPQLQEAVRKLPTPRDAFNFTKTPQNKLNVRSDWPLVNLDVMRKAVFAKFSNNSALKQLLLSTRNAVLIEDAGPNDNFYGAGGDCNGENWLGQILMETRQQLGGEGY